MSQVDLIMPKMGESIMEATILKWLKKPGDPVALDETVLEIATDKVDSEVPSPVAGILGEILFPENAVVPVGQAIARIKTGAESALPANGNGQSATSGSVTPPPAAPAATVSVKSISPDPPAQASPVAPVGRSSSEGGRFYSPLVRNIAMKEQVSSTELEAIPGTGAQGRLTKHDLLGYLEQRGNHVPSTAQTGALQVSNVQTTTSSEIPSVAKTQPDGNVEIIEMDRMRRLIADHMVMSKQTSPHVTSFVEIDVTPIVQWRERVKGTFASKYGEKITFTPVFIEAVVKAILDYPMVNISVDGNNIIRKKDINIGMAAALPSGNLIVPVIKQADTLNLVGLTRQVNDLANRARQNKLKPEEIQEGTFTLTNVGTFGNVMGTPIINQPQVAILATGAIRKKPAVVETPYGDLIAVRHMMFLSLSYDHRVVDGALGGSFLRRVGDYLENFDASREI